MNMIIAVFAVAFGCFRLTRATRRASKWALTTTCCRSRSKPADPSKIEVVEVFSYGCPHCFEFEPADRSVGARDNRPTCSSVALPAVFRKEWDILAQAFYAAEVLGVTDKVNMPIFEAIHLKGLNPETIRPCWRRCSRSRRAWMAKSF